MAEHLARDQRRMKKPVVARMIRPREIINKESSWGRRAPWGLGSFRRRIKRRTIRGNR